MSSSPPPLGELEQSGGSGGSSEGAAGGESRASGVLDGLLSTEPADRPEPDRHPAVEHVRIGIKKFLNGVTSADMGRGTTAAENFLLAALAMSGISDDSGDEGDEMPDSADVADVGPRPEPPGPEP